MAGPEDVPIRDAATVMLLRDAVDGPEVFMLKRNPSATFVGGAYVFPGGAVDAVDCEADLDPICSGRSDADASARLNLDRGGLAYFVAAIRECFEEAGVLLATDASGEIIRFDDRVVADRFDTHRAAVDGGDRRLVEVCAEEGLMLAVDRMEYAAHWVTPVGPPRRFDTRFFAAQAPEAQVGAHDDAETVANLWVKPAEALEMHGAGELEMILPTVATLESLCGHATAADAVASFAAIETFPEILPKLRTSPNGEPQVVLPGDDGYDDL